MITALRGPAGRSLLRIAVPVTLQTVVFSSKSVVDAVMLGTQTEIDVAAIGIASKATFVVSIFLIGFTIGGAQIGAQLWGGERPDRAVRLRQTVWLTWATSTVCALAAFVTFAVVPEAVIGLGTDSAAVVERGAAFLRIVSPTFLLFCYTSAVAAGLRVMLQPTISTVYAVVGVVLNVALNAVLIFGLLGAPRLGVVGAAYGTLVSAVVETGLLAVHLLTTRHVLARFPRAELGLVTRAQTVALLRLSVPAACNSTIWALGSFAFYAVIGSTGVSAAAALAILSPVESLALALTIGLANAAAVVVGSTIGSGHVEDAYRQAWALVRLGLLVGVATCVVTWAAQDAVLGMFGAITPETRALTETLFAVLVVSFVLKSVSMVMVLGVLRAGGEVRFCLLLDVGAQWVLLLPGALLLRDVVGVGPVLVFALVLVEEAVRIGVAGWRIRSRRWLNDLT
ncbi:MATE family efflux transporter [Isoptericola sp. AK164]|uniref:MATE family efflux transporter n=1 Tax=Isoptericola sp. AK164 TaxID=3024246 RepID=UPI0024189F19|nr:MATE family efflux transporter [Isoptericola sp. AK164]